MAPYTTINEVIRNGLELRVECRKCRHVERADPQDAKNFVAAVHRGSALLKAHRLERVHKGNPDMTLQGCLDGVPCPICGSIEWKVDTIKPLSGPA